MLNIFVSMLMRNSEHCNVFLVIFLSAFDIKVMLAS